MNKKWLVAVQLGISLCFMKEFSYADGNAMFGLSPEAQGRAEAVVASLDDASAAYYNPALLTRLEGTQFTASFDNVALAVRFQPATGTTHESSDEKYFFIPALYASQSIIPNKLAVGLAVNSPYGLATEYEKTASFRYRTTGGRFKLININPSVAYQINDMISLAAGGMVYRLYDAEVRQMVRLAGQDAELNVGNKNGQGTGYGGNAAVHLQFNERHSLGLVYHSQVRVRAKGSFTLSNIPAAAQPLFGGQSSYTDGVSAGFRLPDTVALGYAYKPTDNWLLELDGQWRNWDDSIGLDVDFNSALADSLLPQWWNNGGIVSLGTKYGLSENLQLNGGYAYSISPVDEFATPLIPDTDLSIFSAGLNWKCGNFSISPALSWVTNFGGRNYTSQRTDPTNGSQIFTGSYKVNAVHATFGASLKF